MEEERNGKLELQVLVSSFVQNPTPGFRMPPDTPDTGSLHHLPSVSMEQQGKACLEPTRVSLSVSHIALLSQDRMLVILK